MIRRIQIVQHMRGLEMDGASLGLRELNLFDGEIPRSGWQRWWDASFRTQELRKK
jgi:hypothetical protein